MINGQPYSFNSHGNQLPSSSLFHKTHQANIFLLPLTLPNLIKMDSKPKPISKSFHILHHVLSHLNSVSDKSFPQLPPEIQESILTQFPHLNNPVILNSMIQSIPININQTWSSLTSLGPRPDPSATSVARDKISEIQKNKESGRENEEVRKRELEIYGAVVRVEEMHEAYEKELCEAQDCLVKVYEKSVGELKKESGELEVNEEILRIFKEIECGVVVEKIEFCGYQLRFFPEELGKLRRLLVLDLSNNLLEVIPDSIAGLQKLECLDVSSNLLESLPDSIGLLLNLKVVNVSGNKLNLLPETITGCSSLVEVDASFNNLLSLPINIGYGLVNLERLSIQLNKICYLPASICQLRSLRYFDAHFNQLHGLPSAIGRLTSVEVMNLSGNFSNLREVPDSISDLCNLKELNLSNNQIRALPDTFGRLEKLNKLVLDQNPLVVPPLVIANKGAKVVKEYMEMRWADLVAEKQKAMLEANKPQDETGWIAWGSSMLNNITSGVAQTVSEYTGVGRETYRDPWLDQQL